MSRFRVLRALAGLVVAGFTLSAVAGFHLPNLLPFRDSSGTFRTLALGPVDLSGPFFDDLGTNGRSCASCHDASEGWTITPQHLQQRFQITQGTDPVFRPVDGANCPSAEVSTVAARTSAYSLLLNKGLIRMSLPVPDNADFTITSINDPYNCPETTASRPALYRRPLPSTNLRFLTGIMWDGREPNLRSQANTAILAHTQPVHSLTDAQLQQIVNLETSLFTAQSEDDLAGNLISQGARGGPIFLALQPFRQGINSGAAFNLNAFDLYSKWVNARWYERRGAAVHRARTSAVQHARHAHFPAWPASTMFWARTRSWLPAQLATMRRTCGSGTDSRFAMMNIGTTSPTQDLPLYEISCNDGTQVNTTDPGRALITGKCADISKFKTPGLRQSGCTARPTFTTARRPPCSR